MSVPRFDIHPAVYDFPAVAGPDRDMIRAGVEEAGVLEPVVVWRNPTVDRLQLVDGRTRYELFAELAAADRLPPGARLPVWEFEGSEVEMLRYVQQRNSERRQMDSSQRAAVAVRCWRRLKAADRDGLTIDSKVSGDALAELIVQRSGSNRAYAYDCLALAKDPANADIFEKVADGVWSIQFAKSQARRRLTAAPWVDTPPVDPAVAPVPEMPPVSGPATGPRADPEVYDALDNPVPAWLRPAFRGRELADAVDRAARKLLVKVRELTAGAAGPLMDGKALADAVELVQREARVKVPHAVCPYCEATRKDCDGCGGRGWVTRDVYRAWRWAYGRGR